MKRILAALILIPACSCQENKTVTKYEDTLQAYPVYTPMENTSPKEMLHMYVLLKVQVKVSKTFVEGDLLYDDFVDSVMIFTDGIHTFDEVSDVDDAGYKLMDRAESKLEYSKYKYYKVLDRKFKYFPSYIAASKSLQEEEAHTL